MKTVNSANEQVPSLIGKSYYTFFAQMSLQLDSINERLTLIEAATTNGGLTLTSNSELNNKLLNLVLIENKNDLYELELFLDSDENMISTFVSITYH